MLVVIKEPLVENFVQHQRQTNKLLIIVSNDMYAVKVGVRDNHVQDFIVLKVHVQRKKVIKVVRKVIIDVLKH